MVVAFKQLILGTNVAVVFELISFSFMNSPLTRAPYLPSPSVCLGCFEEENGNVVWPPTHICDSATHSCIDYDVAFNEVGTVTRYCSQDGVWLKPDFSQCSLKPGTTPFAHMYFTFYTGNENHILRNLPSILRSVRVCLYVYKLRLVTGCFIYWY